MPLGAQTSFPRKTWIASIVAVGGAVLFAVAPAAAAPKTSIPKSNLIDNPTFKRSVAGWSGQASKIKRVRTRTAPNGRHAAKVTATRGADSYTLDDSPSTVPEAPAAGTMYTGSAWVKRGRSTSGDEVALIVREWSADGEYVDSSAEAVNLRRTFTRVAVSHTTQSEGGQVDVYLARPAGTVSGRETFFADAITLTKGRRGGGDDGSGGAAGGGGGGVGGNVPPAPTNPTGGRTTSQIALVTSQESPLLTETNAKYRYIMVRDNLHNMLGQLREVHPEAEILLYKNVAFTLNEPGCPYAPFQGGGVSHCDSNSHEDWYLHDKYGGQRLTSQDYGQQLAMNIANLSYRQKWLDSVLARLRDADNDGSNRRYDGIWLDDANLYPGHGMDGRIAELSDTQYRQATVAFLHHVAPKIEAAGFKTVANLGFDPWESAQRQAALELAPDLSVINREGFVRWGEAGTLFTDPDGAAPHWQDELELAEDIQAAGARFHAITYGSGGDVESQRFGRATFLLAWNGNDGSAYNYRTIGSGPSYLPDWTTDIGVPTSARWAVGQGWRRNFSKGTVVVNARAGGSQSFQLGGSYRRPDGSCVNSVSLGPTQAMVMPTC